MSAIVYLGQLTTEAMAKAGYIKYVAFAVSILVVLTLFLVSYRLAKRRRGVRLGVGLSVMAFGFILSEQIYRLSPEKHLIVSAAVAVVLMFIGGLAIGTAVYPRSLGTGRDIV